MVVLKGIEPLTSRLRAGRSPAELQTHESLR